MTKMMTIRRLVCHPVCDRFGVVVAFQLALAAGAPWAIWHGRSFPGQFPPALRIAALVQAGSWLAWHHCVGGRDSCPVVAGIALAHMEWWDFQF